MRNFVIGLAMASTALTTPAMAREGQWYIQGDAGAMIVEDIDFEINGTPDQAIASHDTGFDVGAVVGYDFGGFRLETETSYRRADLENVEAGSAGLPLNFNQSAAGVNFFGQETRPALGTSSALSFMVNGLLDFGDEEGIQAFAGGGVGIARVDYEGRVNSNGPGVWDDSDTGFAYQFLAGIRSPLSDSWDVGLKYRYFVVPGVDIRECNGRC